MATMKEITVQDYLIKFGEGWAIVISPNGKWQYTTSQEYIKELEKVIHEG